MLNNLVNSDVYIACKDIVQFLASIVTMFGILAIIFNIRKFRLDAENREYDIAFKKKEISVDILHKFATDIIPSIDQFNDKLREELSPESLESLKGINDEKKAEIFIAVYGQCGAIPVLNKLEQICVYIKAGLADEEILFDPMHTTVNTFVDTTQVLLDRLRELDVPYQNLNYVVKKWKNNEINEAIDKKIKDLEKSRPKSE